MKKNSGEVGIAQSVASLSQGDCAEVGFVGGGKAMIQRLAMLGIRPGVKICVLHGPGGRGAVLRVGGTRVALGRGVIEMILVNPEIRTRLPEAAE